MSNKRRIGAAEAQPGQTVQVWGFPTRNPDENAGAFHVGEVLRVETFERDFLDTGVIFSDGRMIFARNYAVAYVVGESE